MMAKSGLLLILLFLSIQGIFSNHEQNLLEKLTNTSHYNKRVRPVLKGDQPIFVKHGITLIEISKINEKQQKMIVNTLERIEWKDELLNWDPSNHGGIKKINIKSDYFWAPRLLLYNNADANYAISRDDGNSRITLNYDGYITWIVHGIFKSSCKINVKYFPLDYQVCSLRIGSWTYGTDKQDIVPIQDEVDLSMYTPNGEWELIDTWAHRDTLNHSCCTQEVAEIIYDIHIKRLPLFYITNFILPCALIAALNAMVFLTPAETGEQLAVGVTILLSLVVFFLMVETRVPSTSDHLPLLSKYYCCTVIEISAVLAVTCIIHKFEHRGAVPLPPWVKKYIIGYMGRIVFMTSESETGNVKQIEVTQVNSNIDKLNPTEKSEKKGGWLKKPSMANLLRKKEEPSLFHGNKHVEFISNSMKEDEQSEEKEMQWKHAANILARFMTIVYIFSITVTFMVTFFASREYQVPFPKKK